MAAPNPAGHSAKRGSARPAHRKKSMAATAPRLALCAQSRSGAPRHDRTTGGREMRRAPHRIIIESAAA
eukprot:scaffold25952_cov101-Isochrysis_galbana.AAC.3